MTRKAPAFQFYADDFLAGTMEMTPAEVGVFIRLLCFQWSRGCVTKREIEASRGGEDVCEYVLNNKFVQLEDGSWINERLEHVRAVQQERSKSGSKGGSKTQAKRQANDEAKIKPPSPSPSPVIYSHTHTPDEPSCVPDWMGPSWLKWMGVYFAKYGQHMSSIQQEANIMELSRRGQEKALKDLEFMIRTGAKNVLDSNNDFQKRQPVGTNGKANKATKF